MSEREYNVGYGEIVLESVNGVPFKPAIATVGGFTVIDKATKRHIVFDWEDTYGGTELDEDTNILSSEWTLKSFDYDFFESQCDDFLVDELRSKYITEEELSRLIELDNQDLLEKFLTSCEIDEVFYECYLNEGDEVDSENVPMKLIEFSIGNYEFSEEQIERYNNKIISENK